MSVTDSSSYSGFLSIPTEIRCQIYDYLLTEPHAITISAGYTTCFGNRIQDRARKTEIPGLPLDLAPLARRHHDASLLSVAKPPTIAVENGHMEDIEGEKLGFPGAVALMLTSRLINDELNDCVRRRRHIAQARSTVDADGVVHDNEEDQEGLSLYVSYPYGVLVLKHQYPYLLKQARRVYISGYYTPQQENQVDPRDLQTSHDERLTPSSSFAAPSFTTPSSGPATSFTRSSSRRTARHGVSVNASRPRLRLDPPLPRESRQTTSIHTTFPSFSASTSAEAPAALAHLITTLFPKQTTPLTKLTTRILFPGEDSYGSVWGDDNSPVSHILRSIRGGKIDMKVLRGSLGTGLRLTARPKPETRIVSTSWVNWKKGDVAARGAAGMVRRAGGRLGVSDLDAFLMGEEGA
ncbi:uncharacterized protein J4E84_002445 [Alternaria hordeiaustralica]|uniref:uncharacterized protein n=1 Tax=Alternaria hordeiaustralica TaxID=1187925 RepID=UPI0020C30D8B|nr:uncharacterized protein J4E84_002445 [Alternaria hordeiaustralica]KAI4693869.1 hypothetical protein J4E84_002445 [Alternaria hordeiaustralica]